MLGTHLFGIYEKAFNSADPIRFRLAKARQLGYDYMEICMDENEERLNRLYWSDAEIRQLKQDIDEEGLPIYSMCLSGHRKFPLGSENPELVRKAREIMERAIIFSARIGVRTIQVAGYDVYYEESTESTRERYLEGLHFASKLAEKYQVMLGIETMDTPMMSSIAKFLEFEKKVNSPWFNVYPDLGNLSAWLGDDVEKDITVGIKSVVAFHVKDTLPVKDDFPGQFRDLAYGEGCVDFVKCFSLLEDLNYPGPYLMEMWYVPDTDEMAVISSAKEYVEKEYQKALSK
ncbi:putative L-ribulose-5-phosphate 3-epimerase SgbU [Clostridia bacterium]|nr:putative L-ribulose-5-phosphate 3-epimerase SgbU [Clostridia bacterium]